MEAELKNKGKTAISELTDKHAIVLDCYTQIQELFNNSPELSYLQGFFSVAPYHKEYVSLVTKEEGLKYFAFSDPTDKIILHFDNIDFQQHNQTTHHENLIPFGIYPEFTTDLWSK